MNDKEKASAVLNYLEECETNVVINILSSMIDDKKLADLYDRLQGWGLGIY